MYAIKITGRITGMEFILSPRFANREDADRRVSIMKSAAPSSETIREVVEV